MKEYLIKDTCIVNEGIKFYGDVYIKNGRVEKIDKSVQPKGKPIEINGSDQFLLLEL
jgi:dihydroorotase